jgi:hypothetical protein
VGVGRAAACAFLSATAGQAAADTVEAAAQGRRKACRNALHEIGAAAERDVQYAGPIARSPGDASAGDQTRAAVSAARGRAGIDPGLIARISPSRGFLLKFLPTN